MCMKYIRIQSIINRLTPTVKFSKIFSRLKRIDYQIISSIMIPMNNLKR